MASNKTSKPWWQEQLQSKQLRPQQQRSDDCVDSENWSFLKSGIDDSRKGLPPVFSNQTAYYKTSKGIGPSIKNAEGDDVASNKQSKKSHKIQSTHTFVSGFDRRRETIRNIEEELQSHPLALYSHFSDCIDPNLYEDVVRILDPEMKLAMDNNLAAYDEGGDGVSDSDSSGTTKSSQRYDLFFNQQPDENPEPKETLVKNPYLWDTQTDEDQVGDGQKKSSDQPKIQSQMQDEEILSVTKEFCEWVASMGGDTNNIEESTILSLFASGYDTKPTLSVPIHVVELNSIPPELRALAGGIERKDSASSRATSKQTATGPTSIDGYLPNAVRHRYGAWYLKPKTWKRMPVHEPLKDPNDQTGNEVSETRKKSLELDYDLAPMQGTKLFMQFVNGKDSRKPEFLENVARIQDLQQQEQQRKQEVEQNRQKKRLTKNS